VADNNDNIKIPVIEEQISIEKAVVTTGSLHVKKSVEEVIEPLSTLLTSESYDIQRVPKNEILEQAPKAMYEEGDHIVIPVLEERLVVEKRLVLVEEIHLVRRETRREYKDEVALKKERVQ
jgi:uncharacterized protein (TIGR02271 family)